MKNTSRNKLIMKMDITVGRKFHGGDQRHAKSCQCVPVFQSDGDFRNAGSL